MLHTQQVTSFAVLGSTRLFPHLFNNEGPKIYTNEVINYARSNY